MFIIQISKIYILKSSGFFRSTVVQIVFLYMDEKDIWMHAEYMIIPPPISNAFQLLNNLLQGMFGESAFIYQIWKIWCYCSPPWRGHHVQSGLDQSPTRGQIGRSINGAPILPRPLINQIGSSLKEMFGQKEHHQKSSLHGGPVQYGFPAQTAETTSLWVPLSPTFLLLFYSQYYQSQLKIQNGVSSDISSLLHTPLALIPNGISNTHHFIVGHRIRINLPHGTSPSSELIYI